MKLKDTKKVSIAYGLIALLLFGLTVCGCYGIYTKNKPAGEAEVVFLGDSVIAQSRDDSAIPRQVEQLTGRSVVNCALGGTSLSRGKAKRPGEQGDSMEDANGVLSMEALSRAMIHGDFGGQQAVQSKEQALYYLPYTVDTLASIDFAKVKVLVFNHGVNDYHQGVELFNDQDPYDVHTFSGAMRSVLERLRKEYPDLKIIYVTPTYTWYHGPAKSCEEYHTGSGILKDYVDEAIRICEEYQVPYVDVYSSLYERYGMDGYVRKIAEQYTLDGVHPNEYGRGLIAEAIAEALK
ncbi:MAG: hypothetical protein IKL04_06020 [Lachnospiraceae bacterium]|nr:hypothetical protein [Lachnospiraceae bacterium]